MLPGDGLPELPQHPNQVGQEIGPQAGAVVEELGEGPKEAFFVELTAVVLVPKEVLVTSSVVFLVGREGGRREGGRK